MGLRSFFVQEHEKGDDLAAANVLASLTDEELAVVDASTGGLSPDVRADVVRFRKTKGLGFVLHRLSPPPSAGLTPLEYRTFNFARVLMCRFAERISAWIIWTINPAGVGAPADSSDWNKSVFTAIDGQLKAAGAAYNGVLRILMQQSLVAEGGYNNSEAAGIVNAAISSHRRQEGAAWYKWFKSSPFACNTAGMTYWYTVAEVFIASEAAGLFRVEGTQAGGTYESKAYADSVRRAFEQGGPTSMPWFADEGMKYTDPSGGPEERDMSAAEEGGCRCKKRKKLNKILGFAGPAMTIAAPIAGLVPGVGPLLTLGLGAAGMGLTAYSANQKRNEQIAAQQAAMQQAAAADPNMAAALAQQQMALAQAQNPTGFATDQNFLSALTRLATSASQAVGKELSATDAAILAKDALLGPSPTQAPAANFVKDADVAGLESQPATTPIFSNTSLPPIDPEFMGLPPDVALLLTRNKRTAMGIQVGGPDDGTQYDRISEFGGEVVDDMGGDDDGGDDDGGDDDDEVGGPGHTMRCVRNWRRKHPGQPLPPGLVARLAPLMTTSPTITPAPTQGGDYDDDDGGPLDLLVSVDEEEGGFPFGKKKKKKGKKGKKKNIFKKLFGTMLKGPGGMMPHKLLLGKLLNKKKKKKKSRRSGSSSEGNSPQEQIAEAKTSVEAQTAIDAVDRAIGQGADVQRDWSQLTGMPPAQFDPYAQDPFGQQPQPQGAPAQQPWGPGPDFLSTDPMLDDMPDEDIDAAIAALNELINQDDQRVIDETFGSMTQSGPLPDPFGMAAQPSREDL